MSTVKISIASCDLWDTESSVLFINRLANHIFSYERHLNQRLAGRLVAAYRDHDHVDHIVIPTESKLPFPFLCVVNFRMTDLPFDYRAVDKYARQIIRILREEPALSECRRVATRVFGRSGLDISESFETMISAFASEIRLLGKPNNLEEIQFVEFNAKVATRLQQHLEYLLREGTTLQAAGDLLQLNLNDSDAIIAKEEDRFESLSRRPIFVAMPFTKEFDNVYFFGIKGPVEEHKRKCERVDHEHFTGDVITRIKERIAACEIVIGDLTGANANVFYEIGYAEGLGRPVILLSQDEDTPIDLSTQKQIRYDPLNILELASELRACLDQLLPRPR